MFSNLKKIIRSIQIYFKYLDRALRQTYRYYTSPYPLRVFLKQWSLANRALRVFWAAPSLGRPPLDQETIQLILEMKKLNPTWGGQRISDELAKIGYKACRETVLKYLEIYGLHDPPEHHGLSWKEFMSNHKIKISVDFTSVISFLGHQVFIFTMLNLDTRELIFINTTYSPNLEWVKQQFKNAFLDMDVYPSLCICDNDPVFNKSFEIMLGDHFHIKLKRIPYKSPNLNSKIERFHLSLKSEAFDNVIPINLQQTQRVCSGYRKYYNHYRPHQGISGKIPKRPFHILKNQTNFSRNEHLGGKIISFDPDFNLAA